MTGRALLFCGAWASAFFPMGLQAKPLSPWDPAAYPLVVWAPSLEHAHLLENVPLLPGPAASPVAVDWVWYEGCEASKGPRPMLLLLLEAELSLESSVPITAWRSTREWAALLASFGLVVGIVPVPVDAGPAWLQGLLQALPAQASAWHGDPGRVGIWVRGRTAELAISSLRGGLGGTTVRAVAAVAGLGSVEELPEGVAIFLVLPGRLPSARLETSREAASQALARGLSWQLLQVPELSFGYDFLDPSEVSRSTVRAVAHFLVDRLLGPPQGTELLPQVAQERGQWLKLFRGEAEAVHERWNELAGGAPGRDPQLWRALAFSRRAMGSSVGEMAALEQAVLLEPERIDQRRRWGQLAGRLGGWQFVEEAFGPIFDRPELDAVDLGWLGLARLKLGRPQDAIPVLERAVAKSGPVENRYNLACAYALAGRSEEALNTLELAVAGGFSDKKLLQSDPDLANIRGSSRFEALLEKLSALGRSEAAPESPKPPSAP